MKQFFIITAAAFALSATVAEATPPPQLLDDSASFVIAKSAKLGLGEDDARFAPAIGGQRKVEADKHAAAKCSKDADCSADQYCAMGMCKDLCARNTTKKKVKCSGETPVCTADDHDSYCACNDESCGEALSCKKVGSRYSCEPCGAGEKCGCPDGKVSNGAGKCVTCIADADCADNEVCANPKTEAAACTVLTCPTGQYVANHQCNSCAEAITGCQACTSKTNCTTCLGKYQNPANNGGQCVMKTCSEGQYLNEEDGNCYPCSNGCTKCTGPTNCQSCQAAYTLISGSYCELNTCAQGMYLSMSDGQCYACPSACSACSTTMSTDDVSACTACVDDYKLSGTQCVLKSCSEMGYAKSCGGDYNAVPANKSGSDGECVTCSAKSCSEMGYSKSCGAGYSANPTGVSGSDGACVTCSAISGYCTSDSQCGGAEKCTNNSCVAVSCGTCQTASNHTCVAMSGCCTSNSDCGDGTQKCVSNSCVKKSCSEMGYSKSCGAGYLTNPTGVSGSDGACVTCSAISGYCSSDSDCTGNQYCTNNSCVAVSCGTCYKAENHACSKISGCCTSNSDCGDGTQKCVSNSCVKKSCGEMGYSTSCPSSGYTKNDAGVSGSDGACYTCSASKCPPSLSTNPTCGAGTIVTESTAYSGSDTCKFCKSCNKGEKCSCPDGQVANGSGGCTAADPCANVTCSGGKVCSAGSCVCPTGKPYADSNGICQPCLQDSHCGTNQYCYNNGAGARSCDDDCSKVCPVGYRDGGRLPNLPNCSGGTASTNGTCNGRYCWTCVASSTTTKTCADYNYQDSLGPWTSTCASGGGTVKNTTISGGRTCYYCEKGSSCSSLNSAYFEVGTKTCSSGETAVYTGQSANGKSCYQCKTSCSKWGYFEQGKGNCPSNQTEAKTSQTGAEGTCYTCVNKTCENSGYTSDASKSPQPNFVVTTINGTKCYCVNCSGSGTSSGGTSSTSCSSLTTGTIPNGDTVCTKKSDGSFYYSYIKLSSVTNSYSVSQSGVSTSLVSCSCTSKSTYGTKCVQASCKHQYGGKSFTVTGSF